MNNNDRLSELEEDIANISEKLEILKEDYQETKDYIVHFKVSWGEFEHTLFLISVLLGFIIVGNLLNIVVQEWPTFLAAAIWIAGSILLLWLIIAIIQSLRKGALRLFSFHKKQPK